MAFNVVASMMKSAMEHLAAGRRAEAEGMLRQVAAAEPGHATALYLLAWIARKKGLLQQANELADQAANAEPSDARWQAEMGETWLMLREFEAAIVHLREAYEVGGGDLRVAALLGGALLSERRFAEALPLLERCAAASPRNAEAQSQIGVALRMLGQRERSLEHLRRAYELAPDSAKYAALVGNMLIKMGRAGEAVEYCERAVGAEPGNVNWRLDYSIALLTLGRYKEGWAAYESRPAGVNLQRDRQERMWDGREVKSVLLGGEQGFGDVIQFVRYARVVAERGIRVGVVCQPALARLLRSVAGISRIHDTPEGMVQYDAIQFLMGLPRIFGTTVETIPSPGGYVSAEAGIKEQWAARVAAGGAGLRVGLAWSGNPKHENDANRSIGLAGFAPLAGVRGVTFYSLQVGGAGKRGAEDFPLLDLTGELTDFAQTAGLIANLDLVICVDTSVAHLAGAMGKPVWVLVPLAPDWRWMLEREDSPWYGSMRIFRQVKFGEWQSVVERVAAELGKVAG